MQNDHYRQKILAAIMLLVAGLACNFSPGGSSANAELNATLTQVAVRLSATAPVLTTSTPTTTPDVTETPDPNEQITATVCFYNGAYVKDVTIPDGTEVTAGETFTKTWEIKNNGCRDWPAGTKLVFVDGDAMDAAASADVPTLPVPVGQSREISVELVAPDTPGEYTGYWKLLSPEGFEFGDRIFVQINSVTKADEPTATPDTKVDRPDLTIGTITLKPDPPVINSDLKVVVEVLNTGNKISAPAVLKADFQGIATQQVEVPAMEAGHKADVTFTFKYTTAGEYTLSFTIDAENDNVESDETNNKSVKTSKFYEVKTLSSATKTVKSSFCLDIETGGTACDDKADVWWHTISADEKYLESQNGTVMAVAGLTAVSYVDCGSLSLSGDDINGSPTSNSIPDGTYICLKTGAGHYGRILIVTYGKDLEVKYTTWELTLP